MSTACARFCSALLVLVGAWAWASSAHADCCLQPVVSPPAPFHIKFATPTHLGTRVTGRVSSEAPARYEATAQIMVANRVLVRKVAAGKSTTAYSTLTFPTSFAERAKVRAAARASQRRAVLNVTVRGELDGSTKRQAHSANFVMSIR